MPEISRFHGISIRMSYDDHDPPHFHAVYGEFEAKVDIRRGTVQGRLPRRAFQLVKEWYPRHVEMPLEDWQLAAGGKPLKRITPLE